MNEDRPVSVPHLGMAQAFASIFGMRAIEIPDEVIQAERTVSEFFAENNISGWELGGSAARESLESAKRSAATSRNALKLFEKVNTALATSFARKEVAAELARMQADINGIREANERLTGEAESMRNIAAAARNLVSVKGRHNTEIAMQRLVEACKK